MSLLKRVTLSQVSMNLSGNPHKHASSHSDTEAIVPPSPEKNQASSVCPLRKPLGAVPSPITCLSVQSVLGWNGVCEGKEEMFRAIQEFHSPRALGLQGYSQVSKRLGVEITCYHPHWSSCMFC